MSALPNIAGPRPSTLRRALTLHLPMAAIVAFAIGPYLWMLLTSLRIESTLFAPNRTLLPDTLMAANSPVPCDRTRVFITASDHQTNVTVRVAQGSARRFDQNTVLGELELSGIRSAPRGDVHLAVTFELDADGILNVRAEDKESGRATKATMKLAGINKEPGHMDDMVSRQSKHTVI